MWSSSALLPRDVPVEPDAAEAQKWAVDELSRSIYNDQPTLWERILAWFARHIGNLFAGASTTTSSLVVILIVATLIAVIVIVAMFRGRLRRNRVLRGPVDGSATLFNDARTADDLWRDARVAAGNGEWSLACLDAFRGIVRSLDERVLLDETPGMTTHEAALAGTAIFPHLAAGWQWGGDLFDSLAYGDLEAAESDWNALGILAQDIEKATPVRRLAVAQ